MRPRVPIQAMFNSPGPMVYGLPVLCGARTHDPRSIHLKAPAWLFGIKHGRFYNDASPGPVYYPDVHVTRCGMDGTPHYSLYSRPQDPTAFKTPGPGAYSPERAGPSSCPQAPKFSFGSRTRYRAQDQNPAASKYTLPPLIGRTVEGGRYQAPCYSLRGRSNIGSFSEDLQKTPGPGRYTVIDPNITKGKAPLYSLTGRNEMPGDTTKKPGPGAHSPEKVKITKRSAPQTSFGIKHSEYITPLIVDCMD